MPLVAPTCSTRHHSRPSVGRPLWPSYRSHTHHTPHTLQWHIELPRVTIGLPSSLGGTRATKGWHVAAQCAIVVCDDCVISVWLSVLRTTQRHAVSVTPSLPWHHWRRCHNAPTACQHTALAWKIFSAALHRHCRDDDVGDLLNWAILLESCEICPQRSIWFQLTESFRPFSCSFFFYFFMPARVCHVNTTVVFFFFCAGLQTLYWCTHVETFLSGDGFHSGCSDLYEFVGHCLTEKPHRLGSCYLSYLVSRTSQLTPIAIIISPLCTKTTRSLHLITFLLSTAVPIETFHLCNLKRQSAIHPSAIGYPRVSLGKMPKVSAISTQTVRLCRPQPKECPRFGHEVTSCRLPTQQSGIANQRPDFWCSPLPTYGGVSQRTPFVQYDIGVELYSVSANLILILTSVIVFNAWFLILNLVLCKLLFVRGSQILI